MEHMTNPVEGQDPSAETPEAEPKVGAELLLQSLKRTEDALMMVIQTNGRLSAKLGNALRRIEMLEAEAQYQGLLFGNLYHHLELEPPARPVTVHALTGNLIHPSTEGYDPIQNGALRIKFHSEAHPIYGSYEVLVTDVENGGSPLARPIETLHPLAQQLIAEEFLRLRNEGKLDESVFYGSNFIAQTQAPMGDNSVQQVMADPQPAGEPVKEPISDAPGEPVVELAPEQAEETTHVESVVEVPAEVALFEADAELGGEAPHATGEVNADDSERS